MAECKKYGVLSLVDAAHAIGQVKVDVRSVDPDFWITVGLSDLIFQSHTDLSELP